VQVVNRIPTAFDFFVAATMSGLGLFLLIEGSSNKSNSEGMSLVGGAFLLVFSVTYLASFVKSAIRQRRLLKEHFRPH
jgi:hypothetical protein